MAYWRRHERVASALERPDAEDDQERARGLKKPKVARKYDRDRDYISCAQRRSTRMPTGSRDQRAKASDAREGLSEISDDHEAAAFYALSLLAWSRTKIRPSQTAKKPGPFWRSCFDTEPNHRSAHYLILAIDKPQLAERVCRRAALRGHCPFAPHAVDMPSHIFAGWEIAGFDPTNWASIDATRKRPHAHGGAVHRSTRWIPDLCVSASGPRSGCPKKSSTKVKACPKSHGRRMICSLRHVKFSRMSAVDCITGRKRCATVIARLGRAIVPTLMGAGIGKARRDVWRPEERSGRDEAIGKSRVHTRQYDRS